MAGNGRLRESVAVALAGGQSIRKAASAAGTSESSVYRWLRDTEFTDRVQAIRTEMYSEATGKLCKIAGKAADLLGTLLASEDEKVALGAAREVLGAALKAREAIDVLQQIADLKQQIQEIKRGKIRRA